MNIKTMIHMNETAAMRTLLLVQATTFLIGCVAHSGLLMAGYEHRQASIIEAVLALVLYAAAAMSWIKPAWTRSDALATQGIALLGALVGMFTIFAGTGPSTGAEIVYQLIVVALLVWGLGLANRMHGEPPTTAGPRGGGAPQAH